MIEGQNQNAGQFAAAGGTAPAQSSQQNAPGDSGGTKMSLLSMGQVGGIVRSAASEALSKGYEAVTKTITESRISGARSASLSPRSIHFRSSLA